MPAKLLDIYTCGFLYSKDAYVSQPHDETTTKISMLPYETNMQEYVMT